MYKSCIYLTPKIPFSKLTRSILPVRKRKFRPNSMKFGPLLRPRNDSTYLNAVLNRVKSILSDPTNRETYVNAVLRTFELQEGSAKFDHFVVLCPCMPYADIVEQCYSEGYSQGLNSFPSVIVSKALGVDVTIIRARSAENNIGLEIFLPLASDTIGPSLVDRIRSDEFTHFAFEVDHEVQESLHKEYKSMCPDFMNGSIIFNSFEGSSVLYIDHPELGRVEFITRV